jgi:Cys-tRNA(Pro)/Cys-tRNA(Cys) deacylase
MAQHSEHKTNAMRTLDAAHIPYTTHQLETTEALSGIEAATLLRVEPLQVFKTLVTQTKSGTYYVFMVPASAELALKKAAHVVGEKSIAMIKSKDLFPLTGYVHGGCSPLAMKKQFQTTIDETALLFEAIIFSAGKIGLQIEMNPAELEGIIPLNVADITSDR